MATNPDIPTQIIEEFLEELGKANASGDLIARLREALLKNEASTEPALRAAIFPEGS